jgi:hypothetical protein
MPVRIRAHLAIRAATALATAATTVNASVALAHRSATAGLAVAEVILCGLLSFVVWWGRIEIDARELCLRNLGHRTGRVLPLDSLRQVAVGGPGLWRGGPYLVLVDAAGHLLTVAGGYFPLRRVWVALAPRLVDRPDVTIDPAVRRQLTPTS